MEKKAEVLNRNAQFLRVYRKGNNAVSPFVVTYVLKKRGGGLRYGITASKKVGGAVQRNRARRMVKAAVLELLPFMSGSFDVVFVCRSALLSKKSHQVLPILTDQLRRAGVLR